MGLQLRQVNAVLLGQHLSIMTTRVQQREHGSHLGCAVRHGIFEVHHILYFAGSAFQQR